MHAGCKVLPDVRPVSRVCRQQKCVLCTSKQRSIQLQQDLWHLTAHWASYVGFQYLAAAIQIFQHFGSRLYVLLEYHAYRHIACSMLVVCHVCSASSL